MNNINKNKKINYAKIHQYKMERLHNKLEIAKLKQQERKIRKEILKTYIPPFSLNKLNIRFSKLSVIISFISIILYTGFSLYIQFQNSIEVSSVLTASVFTFFGTELVALTTIKNKKIKNENVVTNDFVDINYTND